MSKRELVAHDLEDMPEKDLDRLLGFVRLLKHEHSEADVPMMAAESSLAKDWLTPEEDEAWANL
jgi:hypothetical protein